MKLFILLIFVSIINFFNSLNAQELRLNEVHNLNSKVFFMRHALAPGNGDPENFKLDDCSTQRNLSNDGIYQARKISNEFKKKKMIKIKIYQIKINRIKNDINKKYWLQNINIMQLVKLC